MQNRRVFGLKPYVICKTAFHALLLNFNSLGSVVEGLLIKELSFSIVLYARMGRMKDSIQLPPSKAKVKVTVILTSLGVSSYVSRGHNFF